MSSDNSPSAEIYAYPTGERLDDAHQLLVNEADEAITRLQELHDAATKAGLEVIAGRASAALEAIGSRRNEITRKALPSE